MTFLTRQIYFSAAHRYYNKDLSEAENKRLFGSCYSEHGAGHNFVLEVTLGGEVDAKTGMVVNLVDVDEILKKVTDPMDHHHLNFDVPYFKNIVPTPENIGRYCFAEIKKQIPKDLKLIRVRLYESPQLWADYYG